MTISTSLAEQNATNVLKHEETLIAWVQSAYPNLDLRPGTVLRDLVIKLYAHFEERLEEAQEIDLRSNSLLEIRANPDLADDDQVDRVISNFGITRDAGGAASGRLRIITTSNAPLVVPNTQTFILGSMTFKPDQTYVVVGNSALVSAPNERAFTDLGNGTYTFTIEVEATSSGIAGNVRANTAVSSYSPKILGFSSADADEDFIGGGDVETIDELLARLDTGIAGKMFSGKTHIEAKLKEEYPSLISASVVGFGDDAMLRDEDINNINRGGCVDVYVKTARYPTLISKTVEATLIDDSEHIFTISLGTSDAAGMYVIESIKPINNSSYGSMEIVTDSRGFSLPSSPPHLATSALHAGYSSYQTATISFYVPSTFTLDNVPKGGGSWVEGTSKFDFDIEYLRMPNIAEMQAYIDSATERNLGADTLIKAPIPGLCTCEVVLRRNGNTGNIDTEAMKVAMSTAFNTFPVGEPPAVSKLVDVIHDYLPDGVTVDLPIFMWAFIRFLDGTTDVLHTTDAFEVEDNAVKGLFADTVAFYLDSNDIDITFS